jgi:hypothetical protein
MSESATKALVEYLNHKGIDTALVNRPVIQHEGQDIEMHTRRLAVGMSYEEAFASIYDSLATANPTKVFIYLFIHDVHFAHIADGTFKPIGEPKFIEYMMVRLGVYNETTVNRI